MKEMYDEKKETEVKNQIKKLRQIARAIFIVPISRSLCLCN